jgi:glycosyltransferase involved in cell wall biosynthesis
LKVKYISYPTAFAVQGGGELQLLKTLEAVTANGIDATRFNFWDPFHDGPIDLLHAFSVCNSVELYANMCKNNGTAFVVSPILWPIDYDESERNRIRHILLSANAILPNSEAEKSRIIQKLCIPDEGQFFVVPNGVDAGFFRAIERRDESIEKNNVLCISNIDERKNLHRVALACKQLGLPLNLYGHVRNFDYFKFLIDSYASTVKYCGVFENGSKEHATALQKARLLVLASEYETPGLVAIEAGSAGVPVVVTSVGSAIEYFGAFVNYCDPSSEESIKCAINRALNDKLTLDSNARDHFASFSWDRAARATIQSYAYVMAGRNKI